MPTIQTEHEPVLIFTGKTTLTGLLDVPADARTVVMIANGLGRMKQAVAEPFAARLIEAGLGTLMFDVLTADELQFDSRTGHFSEDAEFQSDRLRDVAQWLGEDPPTHGRGIAAAGAGAAARGILHTASVSPGTFQAVIIDGSVRPSDVPEGVEVPALVLVDDDPVQLRRGRRVIESLAGPAQMYIMSSAEISRDIDPFFSEAAGRLAAHWLLDVLAAPVTAHTK